MRQIKPDTRSGPTRTTPALGPRFSCLSQYKSTKTDAQGALLVEIPPANEGGYKRGKGAGAVGAAGGGGASRSGEGGVGGGKTRERRVRAEVPPPQFTCFTCFTCFTGTQVHILTLAGRAQRQRERLSLKKNKGVKPIPPKLARAGASVRPPSLLALLVQKVHTLTTGRHVHVTPSWYTHTADARARRCQFTCFTCFTCSGLAPRCTCFTSTKSTLADTCGAQSRRGSVGWRAAPRGFAWGPPSTLQLHFVSRQEH